AVLFGLVAGANLLAGTSPAGIGAALLALGVALLFCRALSGSAEVPDHGGILLSILAAFSALLILCAAASALLPASATQGLERVLDRQQRAISSGFSALRYGRPRPGALPEGSFLAKDRTPSGKTALEITMSEPKPIYLRGYVGQTCTALGWKPPDRAAQYEANALFDRMQRGGFFPQTQVAALADLLGGEEKPAPVGLEINNLAAGRAAVYTPYGLLSAEEEGLFADRLGEAALPSDGLFGARQYRFLLLPGVEGRPAALDAERERQTQQPDKALQRYLSQEGNYRRFVYEQYTGLSTEDAALLTDRLGPAGETGKSHLAYDDARRNILALLGKRLTYTDQPEPFDGEGSFLHFTLEEQPSGNALHYATAAVLMLRHYGIPARYVEGYVVTPGDLADARPDQPFAVTDERAHAWAEYYYDGVGWIPFEVTPTYLGTMGMTDDLPESAQPAPTRPKPDKPPDDKPKPTPPSEPSASPARWLWGWALPLLAVAGWLGYRYWLLARRARDCAAADSAAAIRAMMAVIVRLLAGIGLAVIPFN
ncbi:MAG: transglutaminase-like domain-containing protein, partial [Oscillospiraceae bacterium]